MKKNIAIAVAALLATVCFTGCGTDTAKTSESASTVAEVTEAPAEEAPAEETTEAEEAAEAEEKTDAAEDETKADSENDEDAETPDATFDSESLEEAMGAFMGSVDMPEYNPGDAEEKDFVGKWEGDCIVSEGAAYNSVFGIPVSAMMRFEINADGTGVMSSGIDEGADDEESQSFKWTYADNAITFAFEDFDADDDAPASAAISDGKLVLFESEDGEETYVYLKKVTEFSTFDMNSFYESMGINPDDFASSDSAASSAE